MAAVTKSSGRYFFDDDKCWKEAERSGVPPFWVGTFRGQVDTRAAPTPEALKGLCEGKQYLERVQKNRVGCYDVTYTFSKSVSIALFGLTPPKEWGKSSQLLVDATRPDVAELVSNQLANVGAQGKDKAPGRGGAVGFPNWLSSHRDPHAHIHYATPNLTFTEDSKAKSIANANVLFEQQGVLRARAQKRLDDRLQIQGYKTVLVGKCVGIDGVPGKMLNELSSARRAMNKARAEKKFNSARAHDYYARQARRDAGRQRPATPHEVAKRVRGVARKYGVTLESLKQRPVGAAVHGLDRVKSALVAFDVAQAARDACVKRHGSFTAGQFLERLYTLGIGKDTTLESLDTFGRVALQNQKFLGIVSQELPDGTVRYTAKQAGAGQANAQSQSAQQAQSAGQSQSARQTRQSSGQSQSAQQGPPPGQQAAQQQQQQQQQAGPTAQADPAAAWQELKRAARGLATAVVVKTAQTAAGVLTRLAEAVNPPPQTMTLNATQLPEFNRRHLPTPYLLAHAKALFRGALAPGNPHDKAAAAEQVFKKLRARERLPKNTVIIVEGGRHASARDLFQLAKVARRDKALVVLAEEPDRGRGGPGQRRQHHHSRERERD